MPPPTTVTSNESWLVDAEAVRAVDMALSSLGGYWVIIHLETCRTSGKAVPHLSFNSSTAVLQDNHSISNYISRAVGGTLLTEAPTLTETLVLDHSGLVDVKRHRGRVSYNSFNRQKLSRL
jgi:hypothetical protein